LLTECAESAKCQPAVHHLESCTKRVEDGSPENCVEEVFHMLHCINECGSKTLFSKLV
ncbi:hypothetical protein GQ42DRAFT_127527, partial [Ramicandelaber brevisporus]